MKKNIFVYAASLLLLGLGACSEEQEFAPQNDGTVKMTVYASKGDAETRSILSEENGNLNCAWTDGDQLLVTDVNGGTKGILELTDVNAGKFEGTLMLGVTEGKVTLRYFYLGNGVDPTNVSQKCDYDIAAQDGTIESLSKNDALSTQAEIAVIDGGAYPDGTLQLERHFSFAHFTLKLPEGVTLNGEPVTISGENLLTKATLGLADRAISDKTAGTITVNPGKDNFYVNLIPATSVTPVFKVTINGKEYEGSLRTRDITAGKFIRRNDNENTGVIVDMTEPQPDEDPSNPGNTDNWGGDVNYPEITYGSFQKIGPSSEAWCSNEKAFQDFGFAAPVEYEYNAIKNGILTSASYTNGTEAKYFQWGRWLGFPQYVVNAEVNMLAYGHNGTIAPPRGINFNSHYQLYYCWDMDSRPSYAYSSAWVNGMKKQQAVNSSIIYLVDDYDYLESSLADLSWEERSGNPCPDGYRIPTEEELSVFAPSKSFSGSYVEIKNINGSRYAVKWTVTDETHVTITSVYTTKTDVSTSDPIFNNAKAISLEANGMLYSQGGYAYFATSFNGGEKTSGYWTSTVGSLDGHKAGRALMVRIKSGTCSIVMEDVEYTAGLCILPIKDEIAKATAIKPWFPLGY